MAYAALLLKYFLEKVAWQIHVGDEAYCITLCALFANKISYRRVGNKVLCLDALFCLNQLRGGIFTKTFQFITCIDVFNGYILARVASSCIAFGSLAPEKKILTLGFVARVQLMCKNIKYIPVTCFLACRSLEKIDFTNIENIGAGAFVACNSMGNFNLPEGIKRIGEGAFASCGGIEEMRIPLSVEYVGDNAFESCTNLKDIYLLRIKPIEIDSEAAFPMKPCRINVPKGSVDSYQFTAKWKKFDYREYLVGKK